MKIEGSIANLTAIGAPIKTESELFALYLTMLIQDWSLLWYDSAEIEWLTTNVTAVGSLSSLRIEVLWAIFDIF